MRALRPRRVVSAQSWPGARPEAAGANGFEELQGNPGVLPSAPEHGHPLRDGKIH